MMKRNILFLLIFTMLMAAVACSKKDNKTNTDTTTSASTKKEEETAGKENPDSQTESSSQETADKEASDIELSQHRVIASSVAVVEILDALGVPMVGVPTSSYELPESVKEAQRIGNPMSPDMEIMASLEPTVIISVDSLTEELKTQFEALNIPGKFLNLSSYDGLKESITSLGVYFGVEEKAAELILECKGKETAITALIDGKESPSVLIIFGVSGSFMAATESTYVGDLVKRVGATNVLEGMGGSFIPVDMEFLADKNPEYILFMAHANPEESLEAFRKEFDTNEAWQNFDAVKDDKVIALDTGYFGMSANLLATEAMEKLVGYLYTE
ncbi:heme ABC transporter substrate-binding protein IsdE [Anaerocolumna cellulosilytica]|uniref:High-affinity heme uptake system protein IsdE n=1 Tax=Anaerocolumna cellulosilytica TaxID=433286 RepID=A0A6S6QXV0_9FIRM|nr:heme ABC transporter substrate-binding protein IsdE [Anaerocolumna cellulosilytica]MBB5196901.1 iron complex transport system substrate-binding protein [Anaerocolumna cellulosilytica]BCJ92697.1 heme ABC transporter substrate-binding protein IsdE [Anaerocolumna cellulosilytica]